MSKHILIAWVLLGALVHAQDAPEHERLRDAQERENQRLASLVQALEAEGVSLSETKKSLGNDLARARAELERLEKAYRRDRTTRRPSHEQVLMELRKLEKATARAAHTATLAHLDDEAARYAEAADQANQRLLELEEHFAALAATAKAAFEKAAAPRWPVEAARWDRLEEERERLLKQHRALAEQLEVAVEEARALTGQVRRTRLDTRRLLLRENLFLRGHSDITASALRRGWEDLTRFPAWLGDAGGRIGVYCADQWGGLARFGGSVLAVALGLFLLGRWLRRRTPAAPQTVQARTVAVLVRLGLALRLALLLLLVPFLATVLLPALPPNVAHWLLDLGLVLGAFCFVRALYRELFRPADPAHAVLRLAPAVARRLGAGVNLLLYISVIFLPLLTGMQHLGYANHGMLEFLWLFYEAAIALVLVTLLRRRFLFSLLPPAERRLGALLRFLVTILQPVAILVVPALVLLKALRYDILVGLVTRFSIATVVAILAGSLLYRLARALAEVWLRSAFRDAKPARREAAAALTRFVLQVAFVFLALFAFLAASGSDLDEMREFLDVPLPLQGEKDGHVVTWWNVTMGVALLVFFLAATSPTKRALQELVLAETKLGPGVQYTMTTLFGYLFVALGVYLAITQVFNLTNLGYIVAALSVGIGFGLQEIISNFVSGLILLFERPLRVGDMVDVGGRLGVVKNINIRATTLLTQDNVYLMVPNRDFIAQTVVNYAHQDPKMRLHVPLGVSYKSDTELVRKVLEEAAASHPKVLQRPAPEVRFLRYGDSSLDFDLLVWISHPPEQFQIASELYFAIFAALAEHGIEIPFPQRDLHLRSAEPVPIASG